MLANQKATIKNKKDSHRHQRIAQAKAWIAFHFGEDEAVTIAAKLRTSKKERLSFDSMWKLSTLEERIREAFEASQKEAKIKVRHTSTAEPTTEDNVMKGWKGFPGGDAVFYDFLGFHKSWWGKLRAFATRMSLYCKADSSAATQINSWMKNGVVADTKAGKEILYGVNGWAEWAKRLLIVLATRSEKADGDNEDIEMRESEEDEDEDEE